MEGLQVRSASFDMEHVPYRGSAAAISDLLGGQVPMMFADMIAALPHIQSGKLRAIAVGSPRRRVVHARREDRRRAGIPRLRRGVVGRPAGARRHAEPR